MRTYIEKKHYPKNKGGGSFYEWFDVEASGSTIEVSHLHDIVMSNSKKLPDSGSGSGFSLTLKQAKILTTMLTKAISSIERGQGI